MAEANPKKVIYKQIWFWVLVLIIISGVLFFMQYRDFRGIRREMKRGFREAFPQQQNMPETRQ